MKRRRGGDAGRVGKRGRDPVRFAVVGQGYFAQAAVLPAFAQADGCELRAIFSDDATKLRALKRKYGVAAALGYAEYDDYLRSGEVDAVYIALPNDMHADYTIRAAHAGVHVLCEKPMATNSARRGARCCAACARTACKLMIAYRCTSRRRRWTRSSGSGAATSGGRGSSRRTFAMQVKHDNIRTSGASAAAARCWISASTA